MDFYKYIFPFSLVVLSICCSLNPPPPYPIEDYHKSSTASHILAVQNVKWWKTTTLKTVARFPSSPKEERILLDLRLFDVELIDLADLQDIDGVCNVGALVVSEPDWSDYHNHLPMMKRSMSSERSRFNDLQECYLQKAETLGKTSTYTGRKEGRNVKGKDYHDGLKEFQSMLSAFT
uniref:Uncharacterized protein n=1 Tax=Lactuca sativa TaxID=4236 RepID=A0A9R1VP44_LACSA|nr:hypothetical protein LSAT_V11C500244130 [Lactuca sativa]